MTTGPAGTPDSLARDALTVLQPGFTGTEPPRWLLRRLAEGLGAVALFGRNISSPGQLAELTAQLRAVRPEVLVAIDEEGGDVTRLEAATGSSVPGNLALGAVDDPDLTRAVAHELGQRLAACGVNLNWAPSADVNSDPNNPVIGVRSFGADPHLVARHTAAYVEGMQAAGVAACAKHFPGHGDTAVDSHRALPRIAADRDTLDRRELVPFRAAVAAGGKAVMSAHLLLPALDPRLPATCSPAVLGGLLRAPQSEGGLGFQGLIVTDGMDMRAVSADYGIERGSVLAVAAGADAICVGGGPADEHTVLRLRDALVTAVHRGELARDRLADAALRVRELARWAAPTSGSASGSASDPASGPASGPVSGPVSSPASASDRAAEPAAAAASAVEAAVEAAVESVVARATERAAPGGVGLQAARRALRITGSAGYRPPDAPPYVAAFTPLSHAAAGPGTPWGLAAELRRLLPGTAGGSYGSARAEHLGGAALAAEVLADAADRPVIAVVRDVHRHCWMADALEALVSSRPDTVVVETGVPAARPAGALHIATHGAARVCARAAAEVITGRQADGVRPPRPSPGPSGGTTHVRRVSSRRPER